MPSKLDMPLNATYKKEIRVSSNPAPVSFLPLLKEHLPIQRFERPPILAHSRDDGRRSGRGRLIRGRGRHRGGSSSGGRHHGVRRAGRRPATRRMCAGRCGRRVSRRGHATRRGRGRGRVVQKR